MALRVVTGFEFGTSSGWVTGGAGNKIFDTIAGSPSITTSTPRTGTYCFEISASGAAEGLGWTTATLGTSQTRSLVSVWVYFPSSLPAGNALLVKSTTPAAENARIGYNSAGTCFEATFSGGGSATSGTIVADQWYHLEMHHDISANPGVIDWWVDGVAQTQVTRAVGPSTIDSVQLGDTASALTLSARFDDCVVYTDTADITPVGRQKVIYLGPDTSGALDVATITTSEWNTFAGTTPTLSAWDATTALNAIDERPVGLGSSADGFCRITGTDTDYVGIPMTSYTLASGETVTGLRMLACCWAATGTLCTHRFDSYNGATATTLFAAADVGTDNSATAPAWVCKMATLADFNTQAELDALQFRFGSTDTTPDAGIHFICAEVAITPSPDATATPATVTATTTIPVPPRTIAPTRVAYTETTFNDSTTPKDTIGTLTWLTGDVIIVAGVSENQNTVIATPTATGLTFSAIGSPIAQASHCWVHTWIATAGSNGSDAITISWNGSSGHYGASVWQYRNSDGAGTRATGTGTDKTVSLSRSDAHSRVIEAIGDWSADTVTNRDWAPTGETEDEATQNAQYTVFIADWPDQGSAGSTSYGISGTSSTGNHSKIALEVLGTFGVAGSDATATPSVVAATTSISAPTVNVGSTVSATVVGATATVGSASAQGGAVASPTAVAGTASIPAPTASASSTATPSVVSGTTSIPTPTVTVGGDANVSATTVAAVASIAAPTISTGATASPSVVGTVATIGAPSVNTGSTVSPSVVSGATTIPTPTVTVGGDAAVAASTVTATTTIPTPTIIAGFSATATPGTVTATTSIPTSTVNVGVTLTLTTVHGVAAIASPTVTTTDIVGIGSLISSRNRRASITQTKQGALTSRTGGAQ